MTGDRTLGTLTTIGMGPGDPELLTLKALRLMQAAPVVAFFIVVACAATIHHSGTTIATAKDAALALQPFAGVHATWLFALGLFVASIFAAAILPLSTAYSICEGMGWDAGIDRRFEEAPQFFGLYTAMIVIGAGAVLYPRFPLLDVMYFSQVGNGVLLPVILIFMLKLINDKRIMGEFTNSRTFNIIAWVTVAVVILLTLMMVGFNLVYGM